jgi:hypothetical protein
MKSMASTYSKEFPWKKNGPNSPDFQEEKIQTANFL